LRPFQFGSVRITNKQRTLVPGVNYMTDMASWLAVQNGQPAPGTLTLDASERYIRNLRDLAYYCRQDALYQAYLFAAFQIAQSGCGFKPEMSPYASSSNQQGFVNFGMPHLLSLIAEVSLRALKAVWYQKWFVHRRIRPEEYAGRVHVQHAGLDNFGVHGDVLNSAARQRVDTMYGTSLLPMAYNEGCPLHPSYGAGHNVIAGACVTVLKAFFNESFVLPQTWVPSADGLALDAYAGPEAGSLTVGEELDKLASNIAQGRNCGGVHWRSDALGSFMLGQQVAVSVMEEQRLTLTEQYSIKFRGFDGVQVMV
jgi:membrane-associated phospholipid phosphatase